MPKLAIITTIHNSTLSSYEEKSIFQCQEILHNYPKFFVCPQSLDTDYYEKKFEDFSIIKIDDTWQENYYNFGRLKIHPFLYEKFKDYEFVLFYEPDAYIFKDDMEYWMDKGYDYIGAPWFEGYYEATEKSKITGVGNGGFSLRRVSSMIEIGYSKKTVLSPKELYHLIIGNKNKRNIKKHLIYLRWLLLGNRFHYRWNHFCLEDIFWCHYVPRKFPDFSIAPLEEAIEFSFEMRPDFLYKNNNNRLPTGCHAWWKYGNFDFWEKYIFDK